MRAPLARAALHRTWLGRLEGEHQAKGRGEDEIDPQDLGCRHRQGEAQQDRQDDRQRLTAVRGDFPGNDLSDVIVDGPALAHGRSEEHTSELQSLMRTSYAVFCLKKKKNIAVMKL